MEGKEIIFADGTRDTFDTIIWSTGYSSDYSFINIPEALDATGLPLQKEGISTAIERLGFLSLIWMRSRNSALIGPV